MIRLVQVFDKLFYLLLAFGPFFTVQQALRLSTDPPDKIAVFIGAFPSRNYRKLDGTGNNIEIPGRGALSADYSRLLPYRLRSLANIEQVHEISLEIFHNGPTFSNVPMIAPSFPVNAMFVFFGQFVGHDISNFPRTGEILGIPITAAERNIDRVLSRQKIDYRKGSPRTIYAGVPYYSNFATSFLDLNTIYGTDVALNNILRLFTGGALKTVNGYLTTFSITTRETVLFQAYYGGTTSVSVQTIITFWRSGDLRCSDNVGLQSFHHLWTYEHNRIAAIVASKNKCLNDEQIYQEARRWTIAEYQNIIYYEFLPKVLASPFPNFVSYDPKVDPATELFFMAAAMRFGHSLVPDSAFGLQFMPPNAMWAFMTTFIPDPRSVTNSILRAGSKVVDYLRGLIITSNAELKARVSVLMKDLSSAPQRFDVIAFNILRGREIGLPDFNSYRSYFKLAPYTSMSQISSDARILALLNKHYGGNVSLVDAFVGGILEPKIGNSVVGPTFAASIIEQFKRLRDGDRLYFESKEAGFTCAEIALIKKTTISSLLRGHGPAQCWPPKGFESIYLYTDFSELAGGKFCGTLGAVLPIDPSPGMC